MKNLALGVLLVGLFVACSDEPKKVMVVTPDATMRCNPLLNTGCAANEKCTWLLDAVMPNYVGHIGCAPNGTQQVGETCMYGAPGETGYDDCVGGTVCSNFRGTSPGICKQICDQQGGTPACDSSHVCVVYANLFDLGETAPAAAGVCNVGCNPLEDNDYDGSGSDFTRPGTTCGSADEGCYGSPSYGTPPISGWSCTRDINYESTTRYVHRTQCTGTNGCGDEKTGNPYQNSCNQGYLPLLIETTGSTTAVCIAFCEPENCYMGNCGSNNELRRGKVRDPGPSHRCQDEDRLGFFNLGNVGTGDGTNNSGGGEHCQFLWRREVDSNTGTFLPSPMSDKLGFCYDHDQYPFDADEDNVPETVIPNCGLLPDGFGEGTDPKVPLEYFGAADAGCVDTTRLMVNGKVKLPESFLRKAAKITMPRPYYDRRVYDGF